MQRILIIRPLLKFFVFIVLTWLVVFISCKKEYSCENCIGGNKPPIANAGADQVTVLPRDSVTLDGTASSDPDGTIVSYKWIKVSGPASSNILKTDSSKTLVKTLLMGVYKFELTVRDNGGLAAKDTLQIIVNDPAHNQPPVANAGPDQTITLPTDSTLLNGNLSFDPDGTIVSYQWAKISGPSAFNIINPVSPQTKVNGLLQGVYQFELKITDNGGLSAKDTVRVSVNPLASANIPPVANAGNDTTIISNQTSCSLVPVSITLNGSQSYDPDGSIVSHIWSGPGTISNFSSAITNAMVNVPGIYSFILKVTDNNGAWDYDTIQVTISNLPADRPLVPAQLTLIGTLSQKRFWVSAGAISNKIFFAGGVSELGVWAPSRIDILDINSNTWSTVDVNPHRGLMAVATCGNKIFFAGGYYQDGTFADLPDKINIYDVSTNTWSEATLSSGRFGMVAASAGNKVFFAGGTPDFDISFQNTVDVYDLITDTWSVTALSEARAYLSAVTVDDKVYFAGGMNTANSVSGRIDIYDNASSSWSTGNLIHPAAAMTSIAINSKIYWAGGINSGFNPSFPQDNSTSHVEIRDINAQTSSTTCLFQPDTWWLNPQSAVKKNNKLIFFTGTGASQSKFDIYDTITNTWSIGVLNQDISGAAIISVNNIVYVAGGSINGVLSDKVWKLEF